MKATADGGFGGYLRRYGAPATWAIILVALGIFVVSWLMRGILLKPLSFLTDWSQPWGILTYPFANVGDGTNLFWFLIMLYWLYWVGTSAENDLGLGRYLIFFFGETILAGLFVWLGAILMFRTPIALWSLELGVAALTVAWGTRHKSEQILFMMFIPMPGWVLAWLTTALVVFGYGTRYQAPAMGIFAAAHLAVAWLYAENRIPNFAYGRYGGRTNRQNVKRTEKMDKKYYEDVKKREQERADRERLRKLFESSIGDEDKDK